MNEWVGSRTEGMRRWDWRGEEKCAAVVVLLMVLCGVRLSFYKVVLFLQ